jgi:hypothetical protein
MRAHLAIIQPLSLTLLILACATAPRRAETTPHTLWDPITRAELAGTAIGDAYEAVQSLRPRWLRPRMTTGADNGLPLVYVHNMRCGSIYELQLFRVAGIREIRYVNARDATTRWGMGHSNGVIEVITVTDQPRRVAQR